LAVRVNVVQANVIDRENELEEQADLEDDQVEKPEKVRKKMPNQFSCPSNEMFRIKNNVKFHVNIK